MTLIETMEAKLHILYDQTSINQAAVDSIKATLDQHKAECEPVTKLPTGLISDLFVAADLVRNKSVSTRLSEYAMQLMNETLYTTKPDQSARIAELEAQRARLLSGLTKISEFCPYDEAFNQLDTHPVTQMSREAFEKWYWNKTRKETLSISFDWLMAKSEEGHYIRDQVSWAWHGWQACEQRHTGRIAELEAKLAEAEKDAERYRFMRKITAQQCRQSENEADKAIDQAIESEKV